MDQLNHDSGNEQRTTCLFLFNLIFFLIYRKMGVMVVRHANYFSYSPFLHKSVIDKSQIIGRIYFIL